MVSVSNFCSSSERGASSIADGKGCFDTLRFLFVAFFFSCAGADAVSALAQMPYQKLA
jgi:hypothetical protein